MPGIDVFSGQLLEEAKRFLEKATAERNDEGRADMSRPRRKVPPRTRGSRDRLDLLTTATARQLNADELAIIWSGDGDWFDSAPDDPIG